MTERCAGVSQSKVNEWSKDEERSCETPKEEPEAARMRRDREAEARQNTWISCGDHDAGMSRSGMSTRGQAPNASVPTDADKRLAANARKAEETRKLDRPIESDPIGNAIPGLLAGGGGRRGWDRWLDRQALGRAHRRRCHRARRARHRGEA